MTKTCPVCDKQGLLSIEYIIPEEERAGWKRYGYWRCCKCRWQSGYYTMSVLKKLGYSTEPEVVYMVELLKAINPWSVLWR